MTIEPGAAALEPTMPPPPHQHYQPVATGTSYGITSTGNAQQLQLPPGVIVTSPWGRLGAYLLEGLLIVVTLWIGWAIWAATIAGNGQTPAKRLLGQRVIGADSLQPVGFGKMFWVRGLVAGLVAGFAILFTLGIILFMPFWDKRRQNVWDKVSNTYVVNDSRDAWGRKPDLRH